MGKCIGKIFLHKYTKIPLPPKILFKSRTVKPCVHEDADVALIEITFLKINVMLD